MADDAAQGGIGAVVPVGCGQCNVAKWRGAEPIRIFQAVRFAHSPDIARVRVEAPCPAGPEGWQRQGVKGLIRQKRPRVALRAAGTSEEETHAGLLLWRQGIVIARQKCVERAVVVTPLQGNEGAQGIGNLDDRHLLRSGDVVERLDKHLAISGDRADALGQNWPGCIDTIVNGTGDLVFLRISRHLKLRDEGEQRLSCQRAVEAGGQPLFGRAVEPVTVEVRDRKPAVVKHHVYVAMPQVPESWGIAGDTLANAALSTSGGPLGPDTFASFAYPERKPVASTMIMVMTRATGYVSVSREDLVVEQELADPCLRGVDLQEIIITQGLRQFAAKCRSAEAEEDEKVPERSGAHGAMFAAFLLLSSPAVGATLEDARDLMEAGRFEEAMQAFLPAARSGNADAEELIGVMYALGLGVERDDTRAFEWYLRAAMKGHPGAQSGVGWYYEVGRGMPAPDLVRAYMWYVLSAIGGDPDAAISQEEVRKKMTPEQIEKAHILIGDYRPWMYPFR